MKKILSLLMGTAAMLAFGAPDASAQSNPLYVTGLPMA